MTDTRLLRPGDCACVSSLYLISGDSVGAPFDPLGLLPVTFGDTTYIKRI